MHNITPCFCYLMYMLFGLCKKKLIQYTDKKPEKLKEKYEWTIEFIIFSPILLFLFQFYKDSSFIPYLLSFIITIVLYVVYLCYIWKTYGR
jgi:Ca2+/Na+ antiporter